MREDLLGAEVPTFEGDLDLIRNRYYLEATGETQPTFTDGTGAVPVPPTRVFGPANPGFPDPIEFLGTSYEKAVLGAAHYEMKRLPLLGEKLVCRGAVEDLVVKETPKGARTSATLKLTYSDSTGQPVIVERLTFIERP
jgi:hypothetical protein